MAGEDIFKLIMTIGLAVIVVALALWFTGAMNFMVGDAWGQVGRSVSSFNLFG